MQTSGSRWYTELLKPTVRLIGLVMAGGVLLALCTTLGFLGRFSWWLDLFSHFRVHYLVLLVGVIVVSLMVTKRRAAILFCLFLGANLAVAAPLYLGGAGSEGGTGGLRAMLINVKTEPDNINQVRSAIEHYDADILLLEEIGQDWLTSLQPVLSRYPYKITHPRADNFGIGLFSKLPLIDTASIHIGPAEVPSVQASLIWQGRRVTLLRTHPLPPVTSDYAYLRDAQLQAIALHVRSLNGAVLVLGDLNTTPWSYSFRQLLSVSGLRNAGRGFGVQPTWHAGNPVLRIPIDHCLLPTSRLPINGLGAM